LIPPDEADWLSAETPELTGVAESRTINPLPPEGGWP